MRKRVALPGAIKAIRLAKAAQDPSYRGSQFAIACGMSHAHLCNIEAGRKTPNYEVIARIAEQLGESLDAISYFVDIPVTTERPAA